MNLRNTLFAVLAICGAGMMKGQTALQELTSIDATALTATQINLAVQFGPTSAGVKCTNPTTYNGVSVCGSVGVINVPSGNRLVITNISGALSYNPNGGGEVMTEAVSIGINVGGNIFFSQLPVEHSQVVNGTTYYTFNKAVHMFADPGVGFPEILVDNFQGVGPFFQYGTGYMNITIQGYLVKN